MILLAFAILDSFFPLCRQCNYGWKKLQDEQKPAIEMDYIIVVMIFPKTLSANCNIFHLTVFFFKACVCVCTHLYAVLFHENVEIVPCSDNLLQVPSLWLETKEAYIHLILANQNLTEVLLIFSFHH